MDTTYDVRIWKTDVYKGKRKSTHYVRWKVADQRFKESFSTAALAESFRADLLSAARKGEAFRVANGLPVSMSRPNSAISSYRFAREYADMKWGQASANYRRSIAEALTTVTVAMICSSRGRPDATLIRHALGRWAFNKPKREGGTMPDEVASALGWLEKNTRPLSELADPQVIRSVLDALARRLDGKPAAATVVNRKRAVLSNLIGYANERRLLTGNPVSTVQWTAPKANAKVDRRSVVNPIQARTLLNAVREQGESGRRLVTFFAVMYFAGLRPEEAIDLRRSNVKLPGLVWSKEAEEWVEPEDNWGTVHLERATPDAGADWTDSGKHRDNRQLKHRAVGDGRTVPIPPELTSYIRAHLAEFGTDCGRLFVGVRGGEMPRVTYDRVWKRARKATFTAEVFESPLARTPYTLRHACVSTWLNGGVQPTQVAAWAGHSVDVLLSVYAKCLDGEEQIARKRIEAALRRE